MSDYSKTTNFLAKDALVSGDPLKAIKGSEHDTEYTNIATAIATKTNNAGAAITSGSINGTTIGNSTPSTGAFTTLSATGAVTLPAGALITITAEQASTSGTSIDFTGIPAGVKRITIMLVGVSTNAAGSSALLIQLGKSGGVETTGYAGAASNSSIFFGFSTGFGIVSTQAGNRVSGALTLSLQNASTFTWVCSGVMGEPNAGVMMWTGGSKSLSAVLDRVRLTTFNGTDTFDAGAISISYE